jgi:NAD(P)-dependent dehydrogenase (short-subunit alcohol dehydrogenase family)
VNRLSNKRAVVIGGGQTDGETIGFGRAICLMMAREGAHVLVVDRDNASADQTKKLILAEGGKASTAIMDITDDTACRRLPDQIKSSLNGIDILVNNVGILGHATISNTSPEYWDHVMAVNLRGMWMTCKYVLPLMVDQDSGGSVINISSTGALQGEAVSYCVSKAGVNALTRSISSGHAKFDIRANAIMPGVIDTPMGVDGHVRESGIERSTYVDQRNARVPMRYKGSAWDIAHLAVFLGSDESRYISGTEIRVDGALMVHMIPPQTTKQVG